MENKLKIKIGEEHVIDVPLEEIPCKGNYLGANNKTGYFKLDDGRYALINLQEIELTESKRIRLNNFLDARPNNHFLSKKDKSIITNLENGI